MTDETKSNEVARFVALDCVRLEQLRLEVLWLRQRLQEMSAKRPNRKTKQTRR